MGTSLGRVALLASRDSAPEFGHVGSRRVQEDEGTERLRRFLASRLHGRFGALAALVDCSVGRVYAEMEGRQHLSHAVIGRHITGHVASIVATAETAAGIRLLGDRS